MCDDFIPLDENIYFIVYQVVCLLQEEKMLYGLMLLAWVSFEETELRVLETRAVSEHQAVDAGEADAHHVIPSPSLNCDPGYRSLA